MKRTALILLWLLTAEIITAQDVTRLWGEHPDNYRKKAVLLYSYPAAEKQSHKALIICPGGSYCYLAKENEGFSPAQLFNTYGYDCYVLLYRRGMRGNRYPSQIQDLQMAMHHIKTHYAKYDTIGVCGFSAGGHLSGTSAIYFNKDFNNIFNGNTPTNYFRPDFSIMIYPVITMQEGYVHRKSRRNLLGQYYTEQAKDSMSLELHVHNQMPPMFVINCTDDPIVDYHNSIIFNEALNAAGVYHHYKLYNVGGHGFGVKPERIKSDDKSAAEWHKDFIKFISRQNQ